MPMNPILLSLVIIEYILGGYSDIKQTPQKSLKSFLRIRYKLCFILQLEFVSEFNPARDFHLIH